MARVFLDANVLFSAAYGSPGLTRLWAIAAVGGVELLSSGYAVSGAWRNLDLPEQRERLERLLFRGNGGARAGYDSSLPGGSSPEGQASAARCHPGRSDTPAHGRPHPLWPLSGPHRWWCADMHAQGLPHVTWPAKVACAAHCPLSLLCALNREGEEACAISTVETEKCNRTWATYRLKRDG